MDDICRAMLAKYHATRVNIYYAMGGRGPNLLAERATMYETASGGRFVVVVDENGKNPVVYQQHDANLLAYLPHKGK